MDNILKEIEVLFDNDFPYGIVYHPRSNRLVKVKKELGIYIHNAKNKTADNENPVLCKIRTFFSDTHQCIAKQKNFGESKRIKRLMILIQNGCNLSCKYCYADGGTYSRETTHLTPEQGRNLVEAFCNRGIQEIDKIVFFWRRTNYLSQNHSSNL